MFFSDMSLTRSFMQFCIATILHKTAYALINILTHVHECTLLEDFLVICDIHACERNGTFTACRTVYFHLYNEPGALLKYSADKC